MLLRDPISNLVGIIKHAIINNKSDLLVPFNKLIFNLIKLFYLEGYLNSYKILNVQNKVYIYCTLKKKDGSYLIHEIRRISKPSQKIYHSSTYLNILQNRTNGDSTYIISTNSGIFTGKTCIMRGLSGELLCKIN